MSYLTEPTPEFVRGYNAALDDLRTIKPTPEQMLREWHESVGDTYGDQKTNLRADLIAEEFVEVLKALYQEGLPQIAKELADLVYVAYGTAYSFGINLEDVLAEVHRSNMTKIADGIMRRADGKILKGPNYEEADVKKVLRCQQS